MSNPHLPKRGELPPDGRLQRSNAVRGHRRGSSSGPTQTLSAPTYGAGSSGPSRGDQSSNRTSHMGNVASPSQSGLSVSRHAPNTTAPESLLTQGVLIPPNLLGLEGAVCCHDFTSGTDGGEHLLKSDRGASFNIWRKESSKYLTQMYDHFYTAGVEMHNNGVLNPTTQINLNATTRQSVMVSHKALSMAEDSPDSEWASEIKTDIEHFHARNGDYWSHLGTTIENDPQGGEWKAQHAFKTMTFCKTIADVLCHLPPPTTITAAETQPSEPPSTSRTGQRRGLSPGAQTRLGKVRHEVNQRPSTVPDDWVPSPVDNPLPPFP